MDFVAPKLVRTVFLANGVDVRKNASQIPHRFNHQCYEVL
jgi:hypothetical protein